MLKRFLQSLTISFLATIIFFSSALASWMFLYPINVVETANSTRTYYPVIFDFGGTQLVNQGLISSNGTNTNMQIGALNAKFMMSTTNICTVIPSIAAGSVTTLNLYTGYAPLQSSFSIIAGHNGNATFNDVPNLELGNVFTINETAHFNTAFNGTRINKDGAIVQSNNGSGNVTTYFPGISGIQVAVLTPTANGSVTNFTSVVGAANDWQAVLTNDGNTSYIRAVPVSQCVDLFEASNVTSLPAPISAVVIHNLASKTNTQTDGTAISINGTIYYGTLTAIALGTYTDVTTTYSLNPSNNLTWTINDINNLEIGCYANNAAGELRVTQVYAGILIEPQITATGISSGLHELSIKADGSNLTALLDGVVNNTFPYGNLTLVANTPNNWTLNLTDPMPYLDKLTITVNGTLVLWYEPNVMLIGNSLPDRSGFANTGTINFGANSGLNIIAGEPISFASSTATTNQTAGFAVGGATMPSTWYAHGENLAQLPFYDAFQNVANQDGRPVQFYYMLASFGLALGVFIMLVMFTRSALLGYISMLLVLGIASSMTIIPAWLVFALAVVGVSIMYLYSQFRMGG